MSLVLRLAFIFYWIASAIADQSWPADLLEDKGFRNMLLTSDGQHLIVSGLNGVYNLNTTDFELLNQAVTGPVANTDDVIKLMIYNKTENDSDGFITTCSSSRDYCDIREIYDISRSINHLDPPVKVNGADAFMATYVKTSGRNRKQDFLFIGCPHVEGQGDLGGRCTKPGISWYLNSGIDKGRPWYGFKSHEETPVYTLKYIEAFSIDNYRLFFSVQIVKATGIRRSRIAQVCQYYNPKLHTYTTPQTYADMSIQCGQLKEIRAVKKVIVGTETLFITVFSEPMKSAVCIYTMENVKKRFVTNIKDCYRGDRALASMDYINFQTSNLPCTTALKDNATFDKAEDYFLCNKDNLALFHQVIGSKVLSSPPVILFDTQLTAVTVSQVDTKIVAFLGTTSGEILKAVVYPGNEASIIQPEIRNVGFTIQQDMYTSHDGKHIFALSNKQVYKEPVESCSGFMTCASCLASKDPYCGWCFLEKKCGTRDTCTSTSEWIPASSNEKCPHVVSIDPTVMSDKEIPLINIEVSHALLDIVRVSCNFSSDEIGEQFHHNVPATVTNEGKTVKCRPTNISVVENNIKGFSNVVVAILANDSDTTIHGNFIIYRCETFDRCTGCTARNWTCKWCTYSNQCINADRSCDDNDLKVNFGECPRITGYAMAEDDRVLQDVNGTVYLSRDSSYNINITGTNLPVPRSGAHVSYKCKLVVSASHIVWLNRTVFDEGGSLICKINKEDLSAIPGPIGQLNATVHVTFGKSPLDGDTMPVFIYDCEKLVKPFNNCGRCKSIAIYQPYLHCQWCITRCIDSGISCNTTDYECEGPIISQVYPLSAHVNGTTLIEIKGVNLGSVYNDTVNAVTIADIPCTSVESSYDPGIRIMCELSPSYKVMDGDVVIRLSNNATGKYNLQFHFRVPEVTRIVPSLGPLSGGTSVTLYGKYLNTGSEKTITIGERDCILNAKEQVVRYLQKYNDSYYMLKREIKLECITTLGDQSKNNKPLDVTVAFDGANVSVNENITFKYVADPTITAIFPTKSFQCGGRTLTINGTNLNSIQKPKIYAVIGSMKMKSEECRRDDIQGVIYCPSPTYSKTEGKRKKRTISHIDAKLGFEMDDVSQVTADNLSNDLAILMYYPDPVLENFTEVKVYQDLQEHLVIKGKGLKLAADERDVTIEIDCEKCNVTSMTNEAIICEPPTKKPVCGKLKDHKLIVTVKIGFLQRNVGIIEYDVQKFDNTRDVNEYIIAGSVLGFLVMCLLVAFIILYVMWGKRKHMKKEKKGLEYKMDKLEAKFRNQCREEFAALQTAVSDLTSDLEGGNVLFRDYDVYARKTLFTLQKSETLMVPPVVVTEQSEQAMDAFKVILRNRQFLLMLIQTLEKQKSFSVHDKSNVATILMVLHHDNMEYITGILTTLLNELIDRNVASQTPKLLLRRSECIGEKLLTHWLSICLYHYLKEHPGSPLYILYKAIKIQTEKGPIDYISNCGKYTLSEDKLFTSADTEINPVTLTLDVKHFDYIENKEKQISVQVLDCDTITQAKGKMLEILYKNVPYSQRPSVHSTNLEIEEGDGGSKHLLNDEDASSIKEGLWKRINTLQHYNIHDGAKVNLYLNKELEASSSALMTAASPDTFIVGSIRKSKPIVRTISGSNFWHLTKKHQTDDEVQLTSDLFLPRLLNTKGTLQTYIDDLFDAVLCVGEEPPIIIKYLFDFLDSSASRCGINDPDVLHTWKCNSLFLRFWVNILKNPEFVFDIHKPLIVDSCLSVVAQTLMDSCSTADLVLGPSSPSNKLLFAKDIPRYKTMVRKYFADMAKSPAVSDQDLNSYLTQKVSQKFSGQFHQSSALIEMYNYTTKYRDEICREMDNLEAASPGTFSPLTSKLQYIFMCMDAYTK